MSVTDKIRELNDRFRTTGEGGTLLMTQGVQAQGEPTVSQVLEKVREFKEFTPDNDPHGEHDFGAIVHDGQKYFWKIDYYDHSLTYGSEEPANPDTSVTRRVLTVMRAEEY